MWISTSCVYTGVHLYTEWGDERAGKEEGEGDNSSGRIPRLMKEYLHTCAPYACAHTHTHESVLVLGIASR